MKATLKLIADIAEGSTTANSLPHIARLARQALEQAEKNEAMQPEQAYGQAIGHAYVFQDDDLNRTGAAT